MGINRMMEIGALPEEWKVVRLEDACINITDGSHFSPKEDKNGAYRIATVANITENGIDIDSCKKISKEDYEMLVKNGCKPKVGDILFSKDGTVGLSFTFKQNENIVLLSSIAIISPKENLYSDYCAYVLKSPFVFRQIVGSKRGTGLRRIILQDLKRISIPLPPLPEQRRIAEVLGTVDSAIQRVGGAIEKTERLKKGLMQRLMTRGIGHERFKFSKELGCEIPEEWKVKTLINAVGDKNDLIVAGPFGSNLKVEDYRNEGIPIIRLQNIEHGRFVDKDIKYTSPEKAKELDYHSFVKGDLVLAKLGDPIGKTCIVPDFLERGIVVADVVRIRIDEQLLDKKYIMYILNSFYAFNQLTRGVIGTTRPRVNLDQVRNLLVPLPPLPEQRRIAEILSAADRKLELERRRKEKLVRVKKGLMNELLTGRKRVKL